MSEETAERLAGAIEGLTRLLSTERGSYSALQIVAISVLSMHSQALDQHSIEMQRHG